MIIFRYLAREVFAYIMMATLLLLAIFISNRLIHFLSIVASGKIALSALVSLVMLQVPHLLGLILPGSLFFGMLLAYSRLYMNSEMTVLFACGFMKSGLVKVSLFISIMVAILVAAVMFWVNPMAEFQMDKLAANNLYSSAYLTLLPGQFQPIDQGQRILFVKTLSDDRSKMGGIFMAQAPEARGGVWKVLSATGGYQEEAPSGDHYVVATDGIQYEGVPGSAQLRVVAFSQYGARVAIPAVPFVAKDEGDLSTAHLWQRMKKEPTNLEVLTELQWRASMPIATLILGLLAVPLSRTNPRQGKFSHLLPSLLIYIFYLNMMLVSQSWLRSGKIAPIFGLWWLHGLMLFFAAVLYWFESRDFRGWSRRRVQ